MLINPHNRHKEYPPYVLHIDADAFFVTCEQAVNPSLKGKPVVTGQERGIVSALSYEAKALGITRGRPIYEVRALYPQVVILPGDHRRYITFSRRMFQVVHKYCDWVEHYSIDECFCDMRYTNGSTFEEYIQNAQQIKRAIIQEVGISVSVGLASTKVLAKVASTRNKPDGFFALRPTEVDVELGTVEIGDVWGIGRRTSAHLRKKGLRTALQFKQLPYETVRNMAKPFRHIWWEMHGVPVMSVGQGSERKFKSMAKTKTFTPASDDRNIVFAHLVKNLQGACYNLRKHGKSAEVISVFLKKNNFKYRSSVVSCGRPYDSVHDFLPYVTGLFAELFVHGERYRSTGVIFSDITDTALQQGRLDDVSVRNGRYRDISLVLDSLQNKFGKRIITLGVNLDLQKQENVRSIARDMAPEKNIANIPFLGSTK